jgi:hypothetical protein
MRIHLASTVVVAGLALRCGSQTNQASSLSDTISIDAAAPADGTAADAATADTATADASTADATTADAATADGSSTVSAGDASNFSDASGTQTNPDAGPVLPLPCPTTNDAGAVGVWENVTPPQVHIGANGTGVPNVVVNPLSPGELYVSTYQQGFYKSSDCGSTWTKIDTGVNASTMDSGTAWLFVIDPITPNVLYADTFNGSAINIFKTTNGGVDWTPLWAAGSNVAQAAQPVEPELLSIDPTNHEHIIASIHNNCSSQYTPVCFAESDDGGTTWRIVNGPPGLTTWVEDMSPIIVNSTTFLLGSAWNPLYLTTNDGASWAQVSQSGGLRMLSVNGWNYVGGQLGMQRSKDLMTWTPLANTPNTVGGGLVTDGQTLFAASRSTVAYVESPASDGSIWTKMSAPSPLVNATTDGAYSFAVDTTHHVLYSANQSSGLFRMITP